MREKLKSFAKLAKIDIAAASFDEELRDVPKRLEEMEGDVAMLERLLEAERAQIDEAESIKAMRVAEIAERNEALSKAKAKAGRATSLREADAAEREVEANRRAIVERKEQVAKIEETLEAKRKTFEERSALFQEAKGDFEKDKSEADTRLEAVRSEREKVVVGRDELVEAVPRRVVKRYEKLRGRPKYDPISFISDGTCTSCHQQLPPQLFIDIQRAEDFHNCPQCHAFIIFKEIADEVDGPSGPAATEEE